MRDRTAEKVAVATPYGSFEPHYVQSIVHLLAYDANHHRRIVEGGASIMLGTTNVAHGRNQIVDRFLATSADWLWWIDSDMSFRPDVLDRLVEAADPEERRIMGALCFALMRGEQQEVIPTLYGLTDDEPPLPCRVTQIPEPRGVRQFAATGAGCVIVHRSVYEDVAVYRPLPDTPPFGERSFPFYEWAPWETAEGADVMGEDLTFCYRAAAAGHATYVDTSNVVGHVKPVVVDEHTFYAQFGREAPAPTFVVIPIKDRRDLTGAILDQLAEQGGYERVFLFDNGSNKTTRNWLSTLDMPGLEVVDAAGAGIHEMWNAGIRRSLAAAGGGPCNIAILNNDLRLGDGFLPGLAAGLRSDPRVLVSAPNYDGRPDDPPLVPLEGICAGRMDGTGGLPGFAFMVRGEMFADGFPLFDEDLRMYFGDNELMMHVARARGVAVMVTGTTVEHIGGGGQTSRADESDATTGGAWMDSLKPELREIYLQDQARFMAKYAAEPAA